MARAAALGLCLLACASAEEIPPGQSLPPINAGSVDSDAPPEERKEMIECKMAWEGMAARHHLNVSEEVTGVDCDCVNNQIAAAMYKSMDPPDAEKAARVARESLPQCCSGSDDKQSCRADLAKLVKKVKAILSEEVEKMNKQGPDEDSEDYMNEMEEGLVEFWEILNEIFSLSFPKYKDFLDDCEDRKCLDEKMPGALFSYGVSLAMEKKGGGRVLKRQSEECCGAEIPKVALQFLKEEIFPDEEKPARLWMAIPPILRLSKSTQRGHGLGMVGAVAAVAAVAAGAFLAGKRAGGRPRQSPLAQELAE